MKAGQTVGVGPKVESGIGKADPLLVQIKHVLTSFTVRKILRVNKLHTLIMKLVGTYEVAQLAGVTAQAVSNWMARRPDFPEPLAHLASGPVWDGPLMRRWLRNNGLIADMKGGTFDMGEFVKGHEYSLNEIRAVLGGETMSYLPQKGSRIVCGRFTKEMNPEAPERVLVGNPPKVQRKANLMAAQGGVLPIFMKSAPGRWEFQGPMEFVAYITDMAVVGPKAAKAGRAGEVVGMLEFRPAEGTTQ